MQSENWLKFTNQGLVLRLAAQPKASRTQLVGPHGDPPDRIKIRIAAPPVEGAANEEIIRFLSKLLKIPKSSILILRGDHSKQKDILLMNIEYEFTRKMIEESW